MLPFFPYGYLQSLSQNLRSKQSWEDRSNRGVNSTYIIIRLLRLLKEINYLTGFTGIFPYDIYIYLQRNLCFAKVKLKSFQSVSLR